MYITSCVIIPQFLDILGMFLVCFLLYFIFLGGGHFFLVSFYFWKFQLALLFFLTYWFFFIAVPICWQANQRHSSFPLQRFWSLAFPFDFFLDFHLFAYIAHLFLHIVHYCFQILRVLTIAALNSQPGHFHISAISEFGPDDYSFSSKGEIPFCFCLSISCVYIFDVIKSHLGCLG